MNRALVELVDDVNHAELVEAESLPEPERTRAFLAAMGRAQGRLQALSRPLPRLAYPATRAERLLARRDPNVVAARGAALRAGVTEGELDADSDLLHGDTEE